MSTLKRISDLPQLPSRAIDSHKGSYGRVVIVGGSVGMSGAIALAGLGALRGGAGLVYLACPRSVWTAVAAIEPSYLTVPLPEDSYGRLAIPSIPEIITSCHNADAVAVGPGLGQSDDLREVVSHLVRSVDVPCVIDADALNLLVGQRELFTACRSARVLTPHPGEFARLTGLTTAAVQANRETLAVEYAQQQRVVLVLKGAGTIVTDGLRIFINRTGNPGMATGGTGDVLTGLITSLIAQGADPFDAACLGCHLHGLAGDDCLRSAKVFASGLETHMTSERELSKPRQLVERVWRAAVQAVDSERLVRQVIQVTTDRLTISGQEIPRSQLRRIEVVGAGKAGAGMARGAVHALAGWGGAVSGWVNVPADCVRPLECITLHAARPAGVNEPTEAGVAGSEEILRRVAQLGGGDLCLVLISGGGSALLPAPIAGVSLADKAVAIRQMSLAGAGINELNCVRRQLSKIKGGGLARACRAQWLITLVISDVIDDPLEVIASGPTIEFPREPERALELLERFSSGRAVIPKSVVDALREQTRAEAIEQRQPSSRGKSFTNAALLQKRHVSIIGNNQTAVSAAENAAREQGLDVRVLGVGQAGEAKTVGRELADECLRLQPTLSRPLCLISGGEPVVKVEKRSGPQKGGRNQELALSALCRLIDAGTSGITILSGGTDGEDGPTNAAGAIADEHVASLAISSGLDPRAYLEAHNSYPFFEQTGGLLLTGPTHTNVMDVRVALVEVRKPKARVLSSSADL